MSNIHELGGVPANNNEKEGDSRHREKVLTRLRSLGLIDEKGAVAAPGTRVTVLELVSDPSLAPDRMHTVPQTGTLELVEMTGYGDTFTDGRIVLRDGDSTIGITFGRTHSIEKV